ncbi:UNVERIFIED_CONTAM: isopropylmalate/homocitrate/citramalate synthase [Xanthomonas axonopodis]
MSETHRQHAIGLVQAYYAAFNRGDWDGMLAFLAEDVAHDLNQGPREIGRNAFAAFLQRMNYSYREQLRDVVVIANDDGTRVGAEYVVHGVYHTTDEGLPEANGQTYVLVGGAFFDVRGDKITRVTNYYNLQEWIAQVSR